MSYSFNNQYATVAHAPSPAPSSVTRSTFTLTAPSNTGRSTPHHHQRAAHQEVGEQHHTTRDPTHTLITASQHTDAQRHDAFRSDLKRLSSSSSHSDRDLRSSIGYLLLRRSEWLPIRRTLFEHENWKHLLKCLSSDEIVLECGSRIYTLITVCAGTFQSEAIMRATIALQQKEKEKEVTPHNGVTHDAILFQQIWYASWSWSPGMGESVCRAALADLLTPLIRSVHRKEDRISRILMKSASRAFTTLQGLWTTGCEVVMSYMMRSRSDNHSQNLNRYAEDANKITNFTYLGVTLRDALGTYIRHALTQTPLLASSRIAWWRCMELSLDMWLTSPSNEMTSDAPICILIESCMREVCMSRACSCCDGPPPSSSRSGSGVSVGFDPFDLGPSSPYLSLTSILLRLIVRILDQTTSSQQQRYEQIEQVWNTLPILHILALHVLLFHSVDSDTHSSVHHHGVGDRSRTPLVEDAEYLLTRYWFDEKRILKVMRIIVDPTQTSTATASNRFRSTMPLYLTATCEEIMRRVGCKHIEWKKNGINSHIEINIPSMRMTSVSSNTLDLGSVSSLSCSPHSRHLLRFVIGLSKKYLLFSSDSVASSSNHHSSSTLVGSSTVRLVQELRGTKIANQIIDMLAIMIRDQQHHDSRSRMFEPPRYDNNRQHSSLVSNSSSPLDLSVLVEQTLLEYFLSRPGRAMRFRVLFDHAFKDATTPTLGDTHTHALNLSSSSSSSIFFAIGIRVLLVLGDLVAGLVDSTGGGGGVGSDSSLSSTIDPSRTLLIDHLSTLVEDVTHIYQVWKQQFENGQTRLVEEKDEAATPKTTLITPPSVTIEEVYPLADRLVPTHRPIIYDIRLYGTVLSQIVSFFRSSSVALLGSSVGVASRPTPPLLTSPLTARPASSRGATRTPFDGATSMKPSRAPNHSPTSIVRPLAPLIPRPPNGATLNNTMRPNTAALSTHANTARTRGYRIAHAGPPIAHTLDPLPLTPRPIPTPPTGSLSAASPRAAHAAALRPIIDNNASSNASGIKISTPISRSTPRGGSR